MNSSFLHWAVSPSRNKLHLDFFNLSWRVNKHTMTHHSLDLHSAKPSLQERFLLGIKMHLQPMGEIDQPFRIIYQTKWERYAKTILKNNLSLEYHRIRDWMESRIRTLRAFKISTAIDRYHLNSFNSPESLNWALSSLNPVEIILQISFCKWSLLKIIVHIFKAAIMRNFNKHHKSTKIFRESCQILWKFCLSLLRTLLITQEGKTKLQFQWVSKSVSCKMRVFAIIRTLILGNLI